MNTSSTYETTLGAPVSLEGSLRPSSSTSSDTSAPHSPGRHRATEETDYERRRALVESLVMRNRREQWTPENHPEPREPIASRLDRWADRVHARVTEIQRRITARRLQPVTTAIGRAAVAVVRERPRDMRPAARSRFMSPLPVRMPMASFKHAVSQVPSWHLMSASRMIPVLMIKR